jgi:phage gp16-like protein
MKTYYRPSALARNDDLAVIHIRKKELGLDDDAYRDLLFSIARVRSSADLDHAGRKLVRDHLDNLARKTNPWGFVDTAAADRRGMLKKLIMMVKGKPVRGYPYALGIAEQMFGKAGAVTVRIELLDPAQLHSLVAALEVDQKRRMMAAQVQDRQRGAVR